MRKGFWAKWVGAGLLAASLGGSAVAGFYDVGEADITGPAGSLIRFEVRTLAPPGATVFRILYRSAGPNGEPIAVSGIVIRPEGPTPPQGRDVVAWAHATTGVMRSCAPSLHGDGFGEIPGLGELLAHGYAVVATDYPGLGTAGPHPYLIGESEGRAVLDSVRAARGIGDVGAGNRFVVWGHSQGGQAALFAGELARRYAPDLRLLGVAAAAPATELGELFEDDLTSVAGKILSSMTLVAWSRLYSIPLPGIVEPDGLGDVERIGGECINSVLGDLADLEAQKPLGHHFLKASPATTPPWAKITDANVPGRAPAGAPILIAQGSADTVVDPPVTEQFFKVLCRQGTPVRFLHVPHVTHAGIPRASARETVEWVAARFAGAPAPNDCGQ